MDRKIKTLDVFKGTSVFIWKKIGVGLLSMLVVVIPIAILFGIGCIFNTGVGFLLGLVGLVIGVQLQKLFNRYVGYMVKAAHVAVITESVRTGYIPDNQYEFGKKTVKDNFTEANVYFAVDLLVSKAVNQIQKKMSGVADFIGNIIPMGGSFINQFIKAALDYIDECCLGYTFYRDDEDNKFKSSCDGIVLYFQNWKDLLKSCLKASLISVGLTAVLFFVVALAFGLIFNIFFDGSVAFAVGVIIGIVIAGAIKSAVIDTYVYIEIMNSFMPFAMTQVPKLDLYEKFCKISSAFKELFNKATNAGTPV